MSKKKEFRVVGTVQLEFEVAVKADCSAQAERFAEKILDGLRPHDQIRVRKGRGGNYERARQFRVELGLAKVTDRFCDEADADERELS